MQTKEKIHTCPELVDYVNQIGFLPLLNMGIMDWSAEYAVDEDCRYVVLPDGGWEWPLWKWKGSVLRESGCAYGKFIRGKACFISKEWWPDFCNYRRGYSATLEEGSIDDMILQTLREEGSMITRELRAACGFNGAKMRSKFDGYVTRLQMQARIVIEDFVYPQDKHGKEYGWGWALLTTPEVRFGKEACHLERAPKESYERLVSHFKKILPQVSESVIDHLLRAH